MPVGSVKLNSQTNGGNIDVQFHGAFEDFFISADRIRIKFFYIKKDGLFRKGSLTFCVANGTLGIIVVSGTHVPRDKATIPFSHFRQLHQKELNRHFLWDAILWPNGDLQLQDH